MVKLLRLAWISSLLGDTDDSWKVIPNSYLSEYRGLQFLLKCNHNAESINIGLPSFYRELPRYFQELKKKGQYIPLGRILTMEQGDNHWKLSRFLEILVQTENNVQDVLNANGNFLTIEEFQSKFKIKTNFLHYLQLIAAFPSNLKKKAATIEVPSQELLHTTKISSSMIPTLDLTKMRCKNYY